LLLILALRGRWRSALLCAVGVAIAVMPWQIWTAMHSSGLAEPLKGSYGSYVAWLAEGARAGGPSFIWQTVVVNVREVGALLADRFALRDSVVARSVTAWFVALLVVMGGWRAAR